MKKFCITTMLFVSLLSGCGGGGGGGGSTSGSSQRPSTGIRVLHASIDSAPVDLRVGGQESVLSTTRFAGVASYASLRAGSYSLSLSESQFASSVIGSADVVLAKGDVNTVLLYGDQLALGVRTSVISDALPTLSEGESAIRFISAAVGAKSIEVSAGGVASASSVSFGNASNYIIVPSGIVAVSVKRGADGRVLLGGTRELASKKAFTILVTGQVGYFVSTPIFSDN